LHWAIQVLYHGTISGAAKAYRQCT
jgi:hypothetical protein